MTEIGRLPKDAKQFQAPKQVLIDAYHPGPEKAGEIYNQVRADRLGIPVAAVEKPDWRPMRPESR